MKLELKMDKLKEDREMEKLRLEQMKEEKEIIMMDTSVLPLIQQEYIHLRQKEILKKMKELKGISLTYNALVLYD